MGNSFDSQFNFPRLSYSRERHLALPEPESQLFEKEPHLPNLPVCATKVETFVFFQHCPYQGGHVQKVFCTSSMFEFQLFYLVVELGALGLFAPKSENEAYDPQSGFHRVFACRSWSS